MNPTTKWLVWAIVLVVSTCCIDFIVFSSATALRTGGAMLALLSAYTAIGLIATAMFWRVSATCADGGARLAATVAFLLMQGLILALVSLMTLLTPEARV